MDVRIIKSPTEGAIDIINRRCGIKPEFEKGTVEAVGLIQGKVIDMIVAADIAEKSSGVTAFELRGNCPQNMVALAVIGDTASVENAIEKIQAGMKEKTRS